MKFNLKLFVLVGVLAGFRDVCGTEKDGENKDYGDFIVSEELWKFEGFKEAMKGNRVIKAVYKTVTGVGKVGLIDEGFQAQLVSILVWDGKDVKEVKAESLYNEWGFLVYNMLENGEYTVYFIFNNGNVVSTKDMFGFCDSLIIADFRYFNAKNVENVFNMFKSCDGLQIVFFPSEDVEKKKRCICCGDEYVCWNNHEVGGLNPKIVQGKNPEEIIEKIYTKK